MSDWTSLTMDLPDVKERRRYALLQTAATLQAAAMMNPGGDRCTAHDHVDAAEALLKDIEHREGR